MKKPEKLGWKKWIMASLLTSSMITAGNIAAPLSWLVATDNADPAPVAEVQKTATPQVIKTLWSGKLDYLSGQFNSVISPSVERETNLVYNIVSQNNLDVLKDYLGSGGDLRSGNDAILRMACTTGSLDIVKFAVDNGADIHALRDQAVRNASFNGHKDIVKYLVDKGADPDAAVKPAVYSTTPSTPGG